MLSGVWNGWQQVWKKFRINAAGQMNQATNMGREERLGLPVYNDNGSQVLNDIFLSLQVKLG